MPVPVVAPPDRNLYELARALTLKQAAPIPPFQLANAAGTGADQAVYSVGRQETFYLVDVNATRVSQETATLRYISEHAYWWSTDSAGVSLSTIQSEADTFESSIYPKVTGTFGPLWPAGQDKGARITVLHASLSGVGGYFSSPDKFPTAVHKYSNQRTMVYLNRSASVSILAHELQHAVHSNVDDSEETWINEGLSEVSTEVFAGAPASSMNSFIAAGPVSLIYWPVGPGGTLPYYGGSFLFMTYLFQHYGGYDRIKAFVAEQADGIAGVDAYLAAQGYTQRFDDVFRDWVIANYLDQGFPGPYGYDKHTVHVPDTTAITVGRQVKRDTPQYGAEYLSVDLSKSGPVRLSFQGQTSIRLFGAPPSGSYCWWGNRGDSIDSTLTRDLDLTGVTKATLNYKLIYQIEEGWDYAYVEVSADGGGTWDILRAPKSTSSSNPVGNSFGPGYTGDSTAWTDDSVDLSAYAGRKVKLRFEYVTDDAVNDTGICFDDVSVPEVGFSDNAEADGRGWMAAGFVREPASVPQDYAVQVIEYPKAGGEPIVKQVALDAARRGDLALDQGLDHAVVVVAGMSRETEERAQYTLSVDVLQ